MSGQGRNSCPFFDEIDTVLGTRAASQPPILLQSSAEEPCGSAVEATLNEGRQVNNIEENIFVNLNQSLFYTPDSPAMLNEEEDENAIVQLFSSEDASAGTLTPGPSSEDGMPRPSNKRKRKRTNGDVMEMWKEIEEDMEKRWMEREEKKQKEEDEREERMVRIEQEHEARMMLMFTQCMKQIFGGWALIQQPRNPPQSYIPPPTNFSQSFMPPPTTPSQSYIPPPTNQSYMPTSNEDFET